MVLSAITGLSRDAFIIASSRLLRCGLAQDTLPRAYSFDIFQDYINPFLTASIHRKFSANELFAYQGVQFKLVAAEPDVTARIGRRTAIFCDGTLQPSLGNLLPPEYLPHLAHLPIGMQMLLVSSDASAWEFDDVLHRRGVVPETLRMIPNFEWPPAQADGSAQQVCMICLADFAVGDACRRLPCRHVYHGTCVNEWLRRCNYCPICKDRRGHARHARCWKRGLLFLSCASSLAAPVHYIIDYSSAICPG